MWRASSPLGTTLRRPRLPRAALTGQRRSSRPTTDWKKKLHKVKRLAFGEFVLAPTELLDVENLKPSEYLLKNDRLPDVITVAGKRTRREPDTSPPPAATDRCLCHHQHSWGKHRRADWTTQDSRTNETCPSPPLHSTDTSTRHPRRTVRRRSAAFHHYASVEPLRLAHLATSRLQSCRQTRDNILSVPQQQQQQQQSLDEQYMTMQPVMPERDYVNVQQRMSAAACLADVLSLKRFGSIERHVMQLAGLSEGKNRLVDHDHETTKTVVRDRVKNSFNVRGSSQRGHTAANENSQQARLAGDGRITEQRCGKPANTAVVPSDSGRDSEDRKSRTKPPPPPSTAFGYNIDDINGFLSRASHQTPANIPMVVTRDTHLHASGPPGAAQSSTVAISSGLVVNARFKLRQWLFVRTPHEQEGYVVCDACTPLGIIGRQKSTSPWSTVHGDCDTGPDPHSPSQQSSPPPPPPPPPPPARGKSNRTDSEKIYANLTRDGHSLGMMLMHVRDFLQEARARSDDEAHTQSADERSYRARRCHRTRHATTHSRAAQHVSDDETGRHRGGLLRESTARTGAGVGEMSAFAATAVDGSRGGESSAFQPLRPSAELTAKSLECLQYRQKQPPSVTTDARAMLLAPRSHNKAVVAERFEGDRLHHTLSVRAGDIVVLLNTCMGDWYWVRDSLGRDGYIPRACVHSDLK